MLVKSIVVTVQGLAIRPVLYRIHPKRQSTPAAFARARVSVQIVHRLSPCFRLVAVSVSITNTVFPWDNPLTFCLEF